MNTMLPKSSPSRMPHGRARFSVVQSVGLAAMIFAASFAEAQDNRDRGRRGGDGGNGGDRGNFNPQEMQARYMTALRERFEVAGDDEWAIISERITKVTDLRRNNFSGMGGMMFGRGGGGDPRGGGSDRGGRSGRSGGSTDVAALSAAIQDKLPDAEVKARLDRVRELRKDNDLKLAKAQEELRAVLSVRQEAIAVLAGLLP